MVHPNSFFTFAVLLCSLNQVCMAGEVYHIRVNSTPTMLCTAPCLIFSEFATNLSHYLYANTILVFLPGTHYLTVNVSVSNIDNFSMTSEGMTAAQVVCRNNSNLHFNSSQHISISNLEFIGCGGNLVEHVEKLTVKDTQFTGKSANGTALEIAEVAAAQIVNSTFEFNIGGNLKTITYGEFSVYESDYSVGGAIIATGSVISIIQSKFENNYAMHGGAIYAQKHSVIKIHNSTFSKNIVIINGGVLCSSGSNITIGASKFANNMAANAGGVLYSRESIIKIRASKFHANGAVDLVRGSGLGSSAGGVLYSILSNVTIETSKFDKNLATAAADEPDGGGVLFSSQSTITIEKSKFYYNSVTSHYTGGGVLNSWWSNITIKSSKFYRNNAAVAIKIPAEDQESFITLGYSESGTNGGALYFVQCSSITIVESRFYDNFATLNGGVLYSAGSTITIDSASEFIGNAAENEGGVFSIYDSEITIKTMAKDIAPNLGGGDSFIRECTTYTGTVVHTINDINPNDSLQIVSNGGYAIIYLSNSELNVEYSSNVLVFCNIGSLIAFNSTITFMGSVEFTSNYPLAKQVNSSTNLFQEGGAVTLFHSNAFFNGNCSLRYNYAENGGGLLSMESKIYVNGNLFITHNTANRNGGGVYLSSSELFCRQKIAFNNNLAGYKGGGIHAVSSSIKVVSESIFNHHTMSYRDAGLNFTKNVAEMGGGLSLEANAKLYILKYSTDHIKDLVYNKYLPWNMNLTHDYNAVVFTANNASYGGAMYVDDDTNSGTCSSSSKTECFFQVVAIHHTRGSYLRTESMHFSQNQANISGSTLYGGLLDRCTVSQFAEVFYNTRLSFDGCNGVDYFFLTSVPTYIVIINNESMFTVNVTDISISSSPVKVCVCIKNEHNCSQQAHIKVKKGEAFNVSLAAVDQVEEPVEATIHASLESNESGLSEGQMTTKVQNECINLTFNVVSPNEYEKLILYALDGPCKDSDLSRREVLVHFLPCNCPIGFQVSGRVEINCTCDCHSDISQYTEKCDSHIESFVKRSQSRAWISYINDTNLTGFLVYQNCPFDYCLSTSSPVNLNQPNGADAQCAFNRSSLLCGSCQPGLSLSLSSSQCLQCPSHWPALLIALTTAAILAGIGLVAFLLFLNVTVAIGVLNGLIFYANIVHANKSILLPFNETNNFITVFISLLNLELGVDTCYFPGMDTYTKTWLQLAFPAFVFYLVGLVIVVSSYSIRFSKLIGNKDPVATLATLILLSYAKLLQICFESLSVGILTYPDGSSKTLWLPDATVQYVQGKHIPLFITAVLILLVGLVYTAVLFFWQWRFYLPGWKIFTLYICLRNQKLQFFIETYHAPFTPKYRYWTGLLLIARAILYLVATSNVSNDPQLSLSAIVFTMIFILLLITFTNFKMYKKMPLNILETFFILNILLFSVFTIYSLNSTKINQKQLPTLQSYLHS